MLRETITKKEKDRRQGLEMNLLVRSFDSLLSPEDFLGLPRLPVHVILDNLRSAFNVGSIIRTADCARIEKVHFCGYTAHPPHQKLEKTALGTLPFVPWETHDSIMDVIDAMKKAKRHIIALETTNQSRDLWTYKFPLPCALILGNEALGVSGPALEAADELVEIPMMGFKNSINVAVAFGIAVYEIQRQNWLSLEKDISRTHPFKKGGLHEIPGSSSPHNGRSRMDANEE
jgi:tRNA G18 (ribose-2'-O)-methylase SpoU